MKKLPLSIIILTEHSDDYFIKSLQSAQIAQEILVIDNNSSNNWRALQQTYSFSVITKDATITHFAELRNEAASYARFDWVFFFRQRRDSHRKRLLQARKLPC